MLRIVVAALLCLSLTQTSWAQLLKRRQPPKVDPQTETKKPEVDAKLQDWTPRPATGKAEPWEKAGDPEWVDARFREMQTGPFLDATIDVVNGKDKIRSYKGTAVRFADGGAVFDRASLRLVGAWRGGYLKHSDRRFGLMNTPVADGTTIFESNPGAGWANAAGEWDKPHSMTRPFIEGTRYRGLHLHGEQVVFHYEVHGTEVLESPTLEKSIQDTFWIGPGKTLLKRSMLTIPEKAQLTLSEPHRATIRGESSVRTISLQGDTDGVAIIALDKTLYLEIPPLDRPRVLAVTISVNEKAEAPKPQDLRTLIEPGAKRWGEPLRTELVRGDETGPLAVDTLTIPYKNPFNALFFCTGVDFLSDGRVAMSTCHGDVWLARVNEEQKSVEWTRFATGLYHPLGLKVVDNHVVVLERGQLTRLHDENNDGEADFYENICNLWDTGGGEHSYDTCLETDPQGNYYFFKTGDTDLPTGGCLMKVSADGKSADVFATGFRHPIGMGMSSDGILTGADQEGNWMPATRIDQYRSGGFYGDMRAAHRDPLPKIYDNPICWLPREVDNSAGGQVWVPAGKFGALSGLPLHLSYGRCKLFVLLRETIGDVTQGAVADLGLKFLSGTCRGRFHPGDGHLYVAGLNGWQTAAQADGCLQRVRATGKPLDVPVAVATHPRSIDLTFSRPLTKADVEKAANYRIARWNYRWTKEYGSKRYKASNPNVEGQDEAIPSKAELLADGKTIRLTLADGVSPVMQYQIAYSVKTAEDQPLSGSVFGSIHQTGAASQ